MNRNIFRLLAVIAIAALAFTGCQKEQEFINPENQTGEEKIIDAEKHFNVLKAPTIVRFDTLWTFDNQGNPIMQKTIKIRNLTWTFIQEWFYEDMHNDGFTTDVARTGDSYGTTYGYYYNWTEVKDFNDNAGGNGTWSDFFYEDPNYTTNAFGFHIPKHSTQVGLNDGDIDKLASVLGSTSAVKDRLNLSPDSWWTPIGGFGSSNYAGMWIDARYSYYAANIVPGCGVVAQWDGNNNNNYALLFTNITDLRANVRLVRTIAKSQW